MPRSSKLKKIDLAIDGERSVAGTGWLPAMLRGSERDTEVTADDVQGQAASDKTAGRPDKAAAMS